MITFKVSFSKLIHFLQFTSLKADRKKRNKKVKTNDKMSTTSSTCHGGNNSDPSTWKAKVGGSL